MIIVHQNIKFARVVLKIYLKKQRVAVSHAVAKMIITNNEQLLRVKCDDVLPEEAGQLIDLLDRELLNSAKIGRPGIGLAAPQIGIAKKIAIVRLGKDLNINLINCKIIKSFDSQIFKDEGCLSFPGRVENTMRFQEIVIADNLEFPYNFTATGLLSVVCQHELDHINSILLPDRALPQVKKRARPNDLCPCGSTKKYKKCCSK